jgi:hypothetical protein
MTAYTFDTLPASLALPGGYTAVARTERDDTPDPPWERSPDGHGPVTEWTMRPIRAGERVLAEDRGRHRYYGWAEAVRQARAEGWDAEPCGTGTPGERAARAVEADFRMLRGWCRNEWEYVGVVVEILGPDGNTVAVDSLSGIESFCTDYIAEVASGCLSECLAQVRLPAPDGSEELAALAA